MDLPRRELAAAWRRAAVLRLHVCAVGSYLARVTRIFDFHFSNYPPVWATLLLAVAIYVNFFTHHFVWDLRWLLFAFTALLFWRCEVHYKVFRFRHRMNMLLGFFLVALFIWFAGEHRHCVSHLALPRTSNPAGSWCPLASSRPGIC